MRKPSQLLIMVAWIILVVSGCGSPNLPDPIVNPTLEQGVTNTVTVPPSRDSSGDLDLMGTYAFTDRWGWYHVSGSIRNNTQLTRTGIQLGMEIRDANGTSLLRDADGSTVESIIFEPHIKTLAPGETSPFSYAMEAVVGMPASSQVTVVGHTVGIVERAEVRLEAEMVNDGNGRIHLNGRLINLSARWARLHALAGAGLDANGQVLTSDWTAVYASLLAPSGDPAGRDATPFKIEFPAPEGAELAGWITYQDIVAVDAPVDTSLVVSITNEYFDSMDVFHLVGTLTNNGSGNVVTGVVAGSYDEAGNVLDAASTNLTVSLAPGMSVPFDLASFDLVNTNLKHASRVARSTLQVDYGRTLPAIAETSELETMNNVVSLDGADLLFQGVVNNTSGRELTGATVIISLLDAQGRQVGAAYTYVSPPGSVLPAGESMPYELRLYLEPGMDMTGISYRILVQGNIQ